MQDALVKLTAAVARRRRRRSIRSPTPAGRGQRVPRLAAAARSREVVGDDASTSCCRDDVARRRPSVTACGGCIRSSAPRSRAVLVLRYYEELPDREIAAVLGLRRGHRAQHRRAGVRRAARRIRSSTILPRRRDGRSRPSSATRWRACRRRADRPTGLLDAVAAPRRRTLWLAAALVAAAVVLARAAWPSSWRRPRGARLRRHRSRPGRHRQLPRLTPRPAAGWAPDGRLPRRHRDSAGPACRCCTVPCMLPASYVLAGRPERLRLVAGRRRPGDAGSDVDRGSVHRQVGGRSRRPLTAPGVGGRSTSVARTSMITVTAPTPRPGRADPDSVQVAPDPNGCPATDSRHRHATDGSRRNRHRARPLRVRDRRRGCRRRSRCGSA